MYSNNYVHTKTEWWDNVQAHMYYAEGYLDSEVWVSCKAKRNK